MLEKSYFRNKLFRKIDLYQYQTINFILKLFWLFIFLNNLLDITACRKFNTTKLLILLIEIRYFYFLLWLQQYT